MNSFSTFLQTHSIILDKAKVVKEKTEEKMIKIAEKERLEENIMLAESDIAIALPNLIQKDIQENKLQEASDVSCCVRSFNDCFWAVSSIKYIYIYSQILHIYETIFMEYSFFFFYYFCWNTQQHRQE